MLNAERRKAFSMAGEHSLTSIFNSPVTWVGVGLLSCFVAHSLMGPLGLTPLASAIDSWITANIGSLSPMFTDVAGHISGGAIPSGEILSNVNPDAFSSCVAGGGATHPHGGGVFACVPST